MIINQILMVAINRALRSSSRSLLPFGITELWNSLTALQTAAVVFALLLTIGAVIEYWEKIKHLALLTLKWVFGKSTPFERCVLRKIAHPLSWPYPCGIGYRVTCPPFLVQS